MSSLIAGLILLDLLVFCHELGHFLVAKKSGVLVEEFSLGMGPLLLHHQWGETQYSIRALPLGGYCKMLGEEESEEVYAGEASRTFMGKPWWVRFLILFAGPLMNFVLALVMLFGMSAATYVVEPVVTELTANSPGEAAGLQVGDRICSINGKKIFIYDQMQVMMATLESDAPVTLEVERDGEMVTMVVQPVYSEENGKYLIGFSPLILNGLFAEQVDGYERASVGETISYSFRSMIYDIMATAEGLVRFFTFRASRDEVGGPVAIFQIVGEGYDAGIQYSFGAALVNLTYIGAVLSANLGVLNLFPIPALDGGQIVFVLIEAIRRKPLQEETKGKLNFLGMVFLCTLMVMLFFGDISRLIQ